MPNFTRDTPSSTLHTFPRDRVFRDLADRPLHTNDQVAVTHLGATKVYDCPGDLHSAVLALFREDLDAERDAAVERALTEAHQTRLQSRRTLVRKAKAICLNAGLVGSLAGLVAYMAGARL